jgi:hypothetical protein
LDPHDVAHQAIHSDREDERGRSGNFRANQGMFPKLGKNISLQK